MNQAKAFANNDVVLLVWDYENPIDDCLGFVSNERISIQIKRLHLKVW